MAGSRAHAGIWRAHGRTTQKSYTTGKVVKMVSNAVERETRASLMTVLSPNFRIGWGTKDTGNCKLLLLH